MLVINLLIILIKKGNSEMNFSVLKEKNINELFIKIYKINSKKDLIKIL